MLRKNIVRGAVFALYIPVLALAQAPAPERAQDRHELRQDHRELRDDRRDAAEITALIARFDAARAAKNAAELLAVESAMREVTHREIGESHAEVAKDAAELGRSRREQWRSGRTAAVRGTARAGAKWRDDVRDRMDDRRDLAVEQGELHWKKRIAGELDVLGGKTDDVSLDRKRTLMAEWAATAQRELARDHGEIREDRRERREDRRP